MIAGDRPPWKRKKQGESVTEISGDTISEAAVSRISSWIQTCQSDHLCKGIAQSPLPKRVLDISSPSSVRLYCPGDNEFHKYACLSHCWGPSRPLITTTENIRRLRDSIPWLNLSKTFQDAIHVARKLGISYLWIDSLCIIQDSKEDWQAESSKMASIYANSTVTLAASRAASDSEGCAAMSPDIHHSQRLTYLSPDGLPQTISIRGTLTHGQGLVPLPLLSRAWVFQERLLSPRIVHFTHEELVWECMEQTTCECGCIRSLWSPGFMPFNKDLLHEPRLRRASKTELRLTWHNIVREYSRLRLTLTRDRLPAISGAAKKFAAVMGCEYLAGLWRDNLIKDLMWRRTGPLELSTRLTSAPTWSWASISAEITYDMTVSTEVMAVVVDASCEALGPDLFGELISGKVVISGLLAPVTLKWRERHGLREAVSISIGKDEPVLCFGSLVLDVDAAEIATNIYCLKLASQQGLMDAIGSLEISLVLKCLDEQTQIYQRIGLLKVDIQGTAPDFDIYEGVLETRTLTII